MKWLFLLLALSGEASAQGDWLGPRPCYLSGQFTKCYKPLNAASGGTGIGSGTSGGIPYFSSTTTIASSGLLTASALVIGGGAATTPSVLALGTANQVVGMNSGATANEYKTLAVGTAGSDFAVANAANSVTFNLPDAGASARGAVTTGTQTLAGTKTLSGGNLRLVADSGGAGNAGAPYMTPSDDTDTGLWFPGANQLAFATAGVSAVSFSSSQVPTFGGGNFRLAADSGGLGSAANPYMTPSDDTDTGIYFTGANVIGISAAGTVGIQVNSDQTLSVHSASWATGVGTTVTLTGDKFALLTSSIRYKENVKPLADEIDTAKIFDLRPVVFDYKKPRGGAHSFGLIAEEVQEVLPQLVHQEPDEAGNLRPESVGLEHLSVLVLVELKKLRARVDELEARCE